ncbi:MAG TPA: hypothetical protein VMT95_09995 [Candidatus Binatia bacterium]|nr:hypothetical protein [Candidatus Binatia bacterium]
MARLLRVFPFLVAAALAVSFVPAPAQSVAPPTSRDGRKDFDFLYGTWHTHYRLLKKRLSNNHQWYECTGTSVVRPFWNGYGNLEDGDLRCAGSHIVGMTLRMYSAQTNQWSLWWGTKTRGLVPPPQVGHFDEHGVGQFYARDKHEGKPIIVRFKWTLQAGDHPYFEQAYSPDDGKTWETNWTCVYTRA